MCKIKNTVSRPHPGLLTSSPLDSHPRWTRTPHCYQNWYGSSPSYQRLPHLAPPPFTTSESNTATMAGADLRYRCPGVAQPQSNHNAADVERRRASLCTSRARVVQTAAAASASPRTSTQLLAFRIRLLPLNTTGGACLTIARLGSVAHTPCPRRVHGRNMPPGGRQTAISTSASS